MGYINFMDEICRENLEIENFFMKKNLFEKRYAEPQLILNLSENSLIRSLRKDIVKISENINFTFVEDEANWDVHCVFGEKANIALLNKKNIQKAYQNLKISRYFDGIFDIYKFLMCACTIFLSFRQSAFINFFEEEKKDLILTKDLFNRIDNAAKYFFENKEYCNLITKDLYYTQDPSISKIVFLGKKYVYTITMLFFNEKITIKKACKLLKISDEAECFLFLKNFEIAAKTYFFKFYNERRGI
ncbi:hypothetical protein ELQ15_08115 [Campylobacter sp. US12a]|uniref:hypothetical protein n=1 Tax=Campylobacter sp. US12a TaxID=2498116 RepID=UPI001067329F|nr:hypothetical protein [Campylobacter sp. US12a]TEY04674.1 hypothetical protein ELQ15_08115 [Campylobacter sp. US12a]